MRKLTVRQSEILKFIARFMKQYGYAPSIQDIRIFFGFKSPNAVTCHIRSLINKGYLTKDFGRARALRIKFLPQFSGIPVVGKIAAGKPLMIEDFFEETLFSFSDTENVFALKVSGDSMEQAHIYNGDYVIVKKDAPVHNGDIIAAVVGEEATVKYFKKIKNKIYLIPANPSYQPVEVKENVIIGKVIGVFRRM
ncbi:MAG TPA: transcriptional repressor LexA [bacterium]|nr:transcriptional repressor LexA [bacterium]HOL35400.1 transcriptional repressor LexA [bacterium]HPP09235.1 transcriptional repressor LexA [bacterium]